MPTSPRARTALLALGLGPCPSCQALSRVAEPEAELRAWWPHREAYGDWLGAQSSEALLATLDRHQRRLARRGARAVLAVDPDYPAALGEWAGGPALLFVWGELPKPEACLVAVVGSRAARPSSLQVSRQLGVELAAAGCCVVSGGAIGVDGAAHEGALAGGGPSVAILGSGLDQLYPERHLDLFGRLARQGAVLSPFAPWSRPSRWRFPRRNQVMARLVRLVVVIEAGAVSGALITAELARAAGVPVLARPGSPGADRLLRSGAGLMDSVDDVLRVLGGAAPRRPSLRPGDPDSARAVEELRRRGALSVDELAAALAWPIPRAAATLMRLQLESFVELRPGGRYAASL